MSSLETFTPPQEVITKLQEVMNDCFPSGTFTTAAAPNLPSAQPPPAITSVAKVAVILWRQETVQPEMNTGLDSLRELIDILQEHQITARLIDISQADMQVLESKTTGNPAGLVPLASYCTPKAYFKSLGDVFPFVSPPLTKRGHDRMMKFDPAEPISPQTTTEVPLIEQGNHSS